MANYSYDEAGNMAAYFLLTVLLMILVPLSIPSRSTRQRNISGCQCQECQDQKARILKLEKGSLLDPLTHKKNILLAVGWSLFAFVAYKASTSAVESKVYNPFEILGLSSGTTLKDIKSHYKKLSRVLHPDKVRLGINETIEAVEARFVEVTKAYKSLTDETIRQNWERYGHPDGRQEVSMGIALPVQLIHSKNNIFVLGAYGAIFGLTLPSLVYKWWFGSRQKTKDGVNSRSAASFFKALSEESGMDEIVVALGKAYEWERPKVVSDNKEIPSLDKLINEQLGSQWENLKTTMNALPGPSNSSQRALTLLYAHFLRLPVESPSLRKEQRELLLQTPVLLSSLLSITVTRSWLLPTLATLRIHAYLAQAIPPGEQTLAFAQLPGVQEDEAKKLAGRIHNMEDLVDSLKQDGDERVQQVQKAMDKWGKLDLVDADFKVIDDRLVTPSSIVYLVVKARLIHPSSPPTQVSKESKANDNSEKRDYEFLTSRKDVEDIPGFVGTSAHAPHWPTTRKPGFWVVLAEPKGNKVVVPPMKITELPYATADQPDLYRSYKMQFQAPNQVATFPWKLYIISDTFVGEDIIHDIQLKIDDAAELEENVEEDEISEPEEDSLAGQMAMMRGGAVKKKRDEESDEESSTDDDENESGGEESSDSD